MTTMVVLGVALPPSPLIEQSWYLGALLSTSLEVQASQVLVLTVKRKLQCYAFYSKRRRALPKSRLCRHYHP
jgi:hypothetical protein